MVTLLAIFVLVGTLVSVMAARFGPLDVSDTWVDRWAVLALSVALASVALAGSVVAGAA